MGSDGSVLSSLPCPNTVPDFTTGTFWGAGWSGNRARAGGIPTDYSDALRHYGSDGTERWAAESILQPIRMFQRLPFSEYDLSWDETARTFWAWNDNLDLVRVTQAGEELYRHAPFTEPLGHGGLQSFRRIAYPRKRKDRCRAPDSARRHGTEHFPNYSPLPIVAPGTNGFAVNPNDGSYWVSLADGRTSDSPKSAVPGTFHLAADGTGIGGIAATGARLMQVDPRR